MGLGGVGSLLGALYRAVDLGARAVPRLSILDPELFWPRRGVTHPGSARWLSGAWAPRPGLSGDLWGSVTPEVVCHPWGSSGMEPACSSQGGLSSRQEPSFTGLPGNWTRWPGPSAVSKPPSTQPQATAQEPLCVCSAVANSATPWTIARLAPLSVGLSRQQYWSGVAISYSRAPSRPRDRTRVCWVSCISRRSLYHCSVWEAPQVPGNQNPESGPSPSLLTLPPLQGMEIKHALLAPHSLQSPFREGVFQTVPTPLSVGSKSPKALRTQSIFIHSFWLLNLP